MPVKIQGSVTGNTVEVDAALNLKVQPRPINVGALGSYAVTAKSAIMAAGLAGASPIMAFLWKPTTPATALCLIRRIKFGFYNLGTGFAAGDVLFDFLVARAFTVQDTGGGAITLTTNNGKLRTAFGTTQAAIQASTTAALSAGTRTLDANPFRSLFTTIPTTAFAPSVLADTTVFDTRPGEMPLILAGAGEGFVIQATVPATGTWTWGCAIDWDEVAGTEI